MRSDDFSLELSLARAGDAVVWNDLASRLGQYLISSSRPVLAACRGKFDPEDLIQETFLVAFEQLDQFRGSSYLEFSSWVKQIYVSRVSHAVRHFVFTQARTVYREIPVAVQGGSGSRSHGVDPADPGTSPSMRAAKGEELNRLEQALGQLSLEYRNVLIWRERESLSFADIAIKLNRSENAVRKLWTRALATLQRLLEAE